ncbi:acyl- thioesterase [Trichoderma arundinaceum]|uniref:Acyl-thioesterase n=1 Tax=Trichoderma arundinaceum TaxID=490622 RepID=A0A395NW15_TRIAR|nr:acyl- thioesterase [Trichoderma arundinaceum]
MVADLPLNTIPPSRPHTHTVIFLHENQSFARDAVNQVHEATDLGWRSIIQNFASTRWVFPQAPTDEPLMPSLLSISTGIQHAVHRGEPSWWTEAKHDDGDEARRQRNMLPGLRDRVKELQKVIRNEVAMLGGHWDRIILGGIGHGAGMAMWTLVTLDAPTEDAFTTSAGMCTPTRLGCFVGVSCEMPLPGIPLSAARQLLIPDSISPENGQVYKKTPVLLQYHRNVGKEYMDRGRAFGNLLVESGVEDVCWREYEDGWPFLNSPRGVEDMKEFFRERMNMRPNW